ncbi:eukaryotic translation initiation factor 2-alpha kinase 1-like isoform X2 [Lycorma delicatula]
MKLIDRSYHMDEFEFMRSHYQRALYNLLTVAKTTKTNLDGVTALCPKVPSLKLNLELTPERVLEWSRYANEFVELEFIARGGFGQVYKARHKLDGTIYAVKKIHLRYQNANGFLRSLREVKMLACLNHANIVAYKAAWLEPFDYRATKHNQVTTVIVDDNTESPEETEESSDIVFEKSRSKSSDYRNNKSGFTKDGVVLSDSSSEVSNLALCKFRHSLGRVHAWNFMQDSFKQDWATLFVQMQLCEKNLREWLDRRNRLSSPVNNDTNVNIQQCLSLFIKVLRGIEYIHDKGIVHHDIKPSNIFVSEDLRQVQVGDFGLACCLLTHTTVPLVSKESSQHKGRIGTKLYAAPEQVSGICSAKSDIYSVGIILLELIRPFHTEMERSKVISQLKRGQIPAELTAKWPDLAKIISQTVCLSLSKRPNASELLKTICSKDKFASASIIICEKDKLIDQLREEIAAKDCEITKLKQQLAEFNINANKSANLDRS